MALLDHSFHFDNSENICIEEVRAIFILQKDNQGSWTGWEGKPSTPFIIKKVQENPIQYKLCAE